MSSFELVKNEIEVAEMPTVPGLRFRIFQGETDYPHMANIVNGSREADQSEWVSTVEDTATGYAYLANCDPTTDMIFAEVDGKIVGYGFDMVRPNLDNIPNCPVPDGIKIRRGTLAEWRKIWEACREAFRDHWGEEEWNEESFAAESHYTTFNPDLWQIAWAGDEVAGGVLNFIDQKENEEFERLRGHTESIFVRRPWRGQGVAKALIAHSFQVLKEAGMTEAALGVDAENLSGALHLYRKMGFKEVKRDMTFHKPL